MGLLRRVAGNRITKAAAVNRRRHFDRAVTHILAGGAPGALPTVHTDIRCCKVAKLQLGPRLLKQVRWNTNTRCGRVLTALKAAATAATRTLAPRSPRGTKPQSTACRPPENHPQATRRPRKNNAARRVTNAQALGISLTKSEEEALSSLYRRRISTTPSTPTPRRARANLKSRRRARPTSRSSRPTAICPAPSVYCTPCARAARGGPS